VRPPHALRVRLTCLYRKCMLWPVQFGKVSAAGRVQGSETAKMKCQEKSREYRRCSFTRVYSRHSPRCWSRFLSRLYPAYKRWYSIFYIASSTLTETEVFLTMKHRSVYSYRTKRQLACPVSNHVDFVAVYRRWLSAKQMHTCLWYDILTSWKEMTSFHKRWWQCDPPNGCYLGAQSVNSCRVHDPLREQVRQQTLWLVSKHTRCTRLDVRLVRPRIPAGN